MQYRKRAEKNTRKKEDICYTTSKIYFANEKLSWFLGIERPHGEFFEDIASLG